jgi:hypothetical protein
VVEQGPLGVAPLAELRHSELVSPALTAQLAAVRQAAGGRLAVGTHRYAFHLPSLKSEQSPSAPVLSSAYHECNKLFA